MKTLEKSDSQVYERGKVRDRIRDGSRKFVVVQFADLSKMKLDEKEVRTRCGEQFGETGSRKIIELTDEEDCWNR